MKRLLFILFAALSFVACSKPVTTERQTISADTMMLHRSNLNNSTFWGRHKERFPGCYRRVCVSNVSRTWQVSLSCPPKS